MFTGETYSTMSMSPEYVKAQVTFDLPSATLSLIGNYDADCSTLPVLRTMMTKLNIKARHTVWPCTAVWPPSVPAFSPS